MAILSNEKGLLNDLMFLLKKTSTTSTDLIQDFHKKEIISTRADINKIKAE